LATATYHDGVLSARLEANLALERSALGAAILDATAEQTGILVEFVGESDWISPLHKAIYRAIDRLLARGAVPLEYASVIAEMISQGTFQSYTNGWTLVSSLGEGVSLSKSMCRRVQELRALWNQRKEAAAAK
jgi:replicative DNA helicase